MICSLSKKENLDKIIEGILMSDITTKIFKESIDKIVLVQLKGNKIVRGKMCSFDQHMNLVLEDAEDVSVADKAKKLGTLIVRGDNIVILSPPPNRE